MEIKFGLSKCYTTLLCVLMFFSLLSPSTLQFLEIPLLLLLCGIALVHFNLSHTQIDRRVLVCVAFLVLINAFFLLEGFLYSDDVRILKQSTVYVFEPIAFTIILLFATRLINTFNFSRIFFAAIAGITIIYVYFIFSFLGVFPPLPPGLLDILISREQASVVNYGGDMLSISLSSEVSLAFLLPYLLTLLLDGKSKDTFASWKLWLLFMVGFSVVVAIGRRGIILVVLLVPFLYWLCSAIVAKRLLCKKLLRSLCVYLVIAATGAGAIFYLSETYNLDLRIMSLDSDVIQQQSNAWRYIQFDALVSEWQDTPFLGAGLGTDVSIVRSEVPGRYELTYVAHLFHVGMVGMAAYLILLFILFRGLVRILRQQDQEYGKFVLPTMVGLICYLIDNATNPIIDSFDGLMMIFYSIGIVNCYSLSHNAQPNATKCSDIV